MNSAIFRVLSRALILALIFAAALPFNALADEGTPPTEPAPAPTEEAASRTEEPAVDEAPLEEVIIEELAAPVETVPEEIPPTGETLPVEEAVIDEPAEAGVLDPILAELPAETEIVVASAEGEVLPLASEEAAEIIAGGDPMWCPAGVTPGGAGCSISFPNLLDLVNHVGIAGPGGFSPAANGVIWITGFSVAGADTSGSGIVFDGDPAPGPTTAAWNAWSNFSLTFKGGWTGTGTMIHTDDQSVFLDPITITNWNNSVTLSDIQFKQTAGTDALHVDTNAGNIVLTRVQVYQGNPGAFHYGASLTNNGSGTVTITSSQFVEQSSGIGALQVISKGNITLSSVLVFGNSCAGCFGASLTNGYGGIGTGSVTIANSHFYENQTNGLYVQSRGTITLNTVSASDNILGFGATLENQGATPAKNIIFTGVNDFSGNGEYGLSIHSKGSVTLKDVDASDNGAEGVYVGNTTGTLGVYFTGTNIITDNDGAGLVIRSNGPVSLNNMIVNSNGSVIGDCDPIAGSGDCGAYIDNTGSSVASPVTLTGTNLFKFNYDDNLKILSDGLVTLNNITANSSLYGIGATINNTSGTTAGVTIAGTNTFTSNFSSGLEVNSSGNISLSNVTANLNGLTGLGGNGAHLVNSDSTSPYSTVNVTGTNTFNGNYSDGLWVFTNGAITIYSLTASNSYRGDGLDLNNTASLFTNSKQPVSLPGTYTFNNNYQNGLIILSYGPITLNNITARNNGLDSIESGADLANAGADTPQSIKLTGTNVFDGNRDNGLLISSKGAVTLNSITASNTVDYSGVSVSNRASGTTTPQDVSLTGINLFSNNHLNGLRVYSYGAITLSTITASGNSSDGVLLDNCNEDPVTYVCISTTPKTVTLNGVNNISDNHSGGLTIEGAGVVVVNSLTASGNTTNGVYVDNCHLDSTNSFCGTTYKKITFTGTSIVSGNHQYGVYLDTAGPVSMNNITASNNSVAGVYFDSCRLFGGAVCTLNVNTFTLTGTNNISSNQNVGLDVTNSGGITINSLTASGNGAGGFGSGAVLDNSDAAAAMVKFTGTNVFNANYSGGLFIDSKGAVTLNSITASNNTHAGGVVINNDLGGNGSPQNVTLTGTNKFNDNYYSGLIVNSYGAIAIANVTANGNGMPAVTLASGVVLDNCRSTGVACTAITPKNVTLTGMNTFNDNTERGLYIHSLGAISSATSLIVTGNDANDGAQLDNDEVGPGTVVAVGGVTLSGVNTFNDNDGKGLWVRSRGAITISNLIANENTSAGAQLSNINSATPMNVTLNYYVKVNGNLSGGLDVDSDGVISLINITAQDNSGGTGIELTNYTEGKGVTISGTNLVTNSGWYGVQVTSLGPVTINSLTASDGDYIGLQLDNASASGPQLVKLTGTNRFENNWNTGLAIYSTGAINLNNISANNNGLSSVGSGVYLGNNYGSAHAAVTITGNNTFTGNDDYGLRISSLGSVTLTKIIADGNGDIVGQQDGLRVNAVNVSLTCGNFTNNTGNGLNILASGTITLKGVISSGNDLLDINDNGNPPLASRTC